MRVAILLIVNLTFRNVDIVMLHSYSALVFLAKAQIYRNFQRSRFDLPGFIWITHLTWDISLRMSTLGTHCSLRLYFLSKAFLRVVDNYTCYSREIRPRLFLCHCKLCHTRTHTRTHARTREVTTFCSSPAGHCGVEISLWAVSNRQPPSVRSQVTNEIASRMIYLVIHHVEKARRWWMAACPYITRRKRRQLRRFAFLTLQLVLWTVYRALFAQRWQCSMERGRKCFR